MNRSHETAHPLAKLFLGNRHLLVLALMLSLAAGYSALSSMPRLEDPVISNRNPRILTLFPGASAERVEALVTEPLEEALQEIASIKDIDSTSSAGVSVLALELVDEIDEESNDQVFSEIRDRMRQAANAFPAGVLPPDFDDKRNAVAFSMILSLTPSVGGEENLALVGRYADEIAERLRQVNGTELVRLYGRSQEEVRIDLDPSEWSALGWSLPQLAARLNQSDAKQPSGVLRSQGKDVLLEVSGEFASLDQIRNLPLTQNDQAATLRLGDIATVGRGLQDPPADVALNNGQRSVLVAARVQSNRRIDLWNQDAQRILEQFRKETQGALHVDLIFEQDAYTSSRLQELGMNLLLGALVVFLVVLFSMGLRAALVVGTALPVSASLTLFLTAATGGELNQMSIFGMIIALGLLIDNAIVITDEVSRGLQKGLSRLDAASHALRHLFYPLLASTLTTVLAFMPILLLPGGTGDFVGPIGRSVILALSASFAVATTLICALAALFGSRNQIQSFWNRGLSGKGLGWLGGGLLRYGLKHPLQGMALAAALPVLGFILAGSLGSQFFPRTDRDMFEVEVWFSDGSNMTHSRQRVERITQFLLDQPGVERVDALVGGNMPSVYYNLIMSRDNSPEYAHLIVKAADVERVDQLTPELQRLLDEEIPEAQILVSKFAQGPPAQADVELRISGPSLTRLRELGQEVRSIMAQHPDMLHTQLSMPPGRPKARLNINESRLRLSGLSPNELAGQMASALEGLPAGSLLEGVEELPLRLRVGEARRDSVSDLARMPIILPNGERLPLAALADVQWQPQSSSITRRNGRRINQVFGFTRSGALPIQITEDILQRLEADGFELPAGYELELGGEAENQSEAVGNLSLYLPLIILMTVATLVLSFRSVTLALLLLVVGPLSAGFGLLATWVWGLPLSFNTMIGSLGLIGLAFNSSIVVLAAIQADAKAAAGDPEAVLQACLSSSRHLLSTTLTTIGSFLPLLIFIGGEFWPPLAVVLAGGAGGSTLLALFFTPAAYVGIKRIHRPRRKPRSNKEAPLNSAQAMGI